MTVMRVLMAAFCALAAGVLVENAKAKATCGMAGAVATACATHVVATSAPRTD